MPEKSQSSVPDAETPAHPEMPLEFNPLQQNFRQNPYPTYRQFREADPVHWSAMFGFWVCTRYDDIVTILRHSKASANPRDWSGLMIMSKPWVGPAPLTICKAGGCS